MKTVSLFELISALPHTPWITYEKDFFIVDMTYRPGSRTVLAYPCKFDGIICMYCIEGHFQLSIGLDDYDVRPDGFAISLPGDIVRLEKANGEETGKVRLLGVSGKLLKEMDFDMAKAMNVFSYRMVQASIKYKILIHNFRNIFRSILLEQHVDTGKSLAYVLGAMSIEIENIWSRLAYGPQRKYQDGGRLTDRFLSLVAKHHLEHREIDYYATEIGLTSKYLSTAVKRESGRTAAQWIVSYVLLEAKYYLKQTKMTIKEIAFELHFSNQMELYRYFLRHTGMTPSDYRNRPQ
uniref:HTH araC/xylS-type domain-containing protein n=1 Tax=uncultured bacterium pUR16A2 TaxID=1204710 RepID=R9QZH2_9BACT|nr:hypothetical protein [uncultured bacterium pUR16A2]